MSALNWDVCWAYATVQMIEEHYIVFANDSGRSKKIFPGVIRKFTGDEYHPRVLQRLKEPCREKSSVVAALEQIRNHCSFFGSCEILPLWFLTNASSRRHDDSTMGRSPNQDSSAGAVLIYCCSLSGSERCG